MSFSSKYKEESGRKGSFKNHSHVKLQSAIKEEQDEEDSEFQKEKDEFGGSSDSSIDADNDEEEIRLFKDI